VRFPGATHPLRIKIASCHAVSKRTWRKVPNFYKAEGESGQEQW